MATFQPYAIQIDGSSLVTAAQRAWSAVEATSQVIVQGVIVGTVTVLLQHQRPVIVVNYENAVVARLRQIERSPVGRIVLEAIRATRRALEIVPYSARDRAQVGTCNAYATEEDRADAAPAGVQPFRGIDDNPATPGDERYERATVGLSILRHAVIGTGRGSDSAIHYSDDMWLASGCCSAAPGGGAGAQPDEVLFHEMLHSLREMQGKLNAVPTIGTARDYENEEEFFAVVLTNIYMSSKGSMQLRASHQGFAPLPAALSTSAGFLSDFHNRRILRDQSTQEPGLFTRLQNVAAPFNPIREYMLNKECYRT